MSRHAPSGGSAAGYGSFCESSSVTEIFVVFPGSSLIGADTPVYRPEPGPLMALFKYRMRSQWANTPLSPSYPASTARTDSRNAFHDRLAALRKERGLSQRALADHVACHVQQLKRYEAGSPTLDVIRNLAIALSVTSDPFLFGKEERGPDDVLRLQFEAASRFDLEEKQRVHSVLEGMILKHEARRWQNVSN